MNYWCNEFFYFDRKSLTEINDARFISSYTIDPEYSFHKCFSMSETYFSQGTKELVTWCKWEWFQGLPIYANIRPYHLLHLFNDRYICCY